MIHSFCDLCQRFVEPGYTIECDFGSHGCGKLFHLSCVNPTSEDFEDIEHWTCEWCTAIKNDLESYLPGGLFGDQSAALPGDVDMLGVSSEGPAGMGITVADSDAFGLGEMSVEDFLQELEDASSQFGTLEKGHGDLGADVMDAAGGQDGDLPVDVDVTGTTIPPGMQELFDIHVHEMNFDLLWAFQFGVYRLNF